MVRKVYGTNGPWCEWSMVRKVQTPIASVIIESNCGILQF